MLHTCYSDAGKMHIQVIGPSKLADKSTIVLRNLSDWTPCNELLWRRATVGRTHCFWRSPPDKPYRLQANAPNLPILCAASSIRSSRATRIVLFTGLML